jgi:hypothetical protein
MSSEEKKNKTAKTGNASNPSPGEPMDNDSKQLLNKKAEKYLREAGNIEDLPDPQEEDEVGKTKSEVGGQKSEK